MDFIIIKLMSNGSSNNPFLLFPDEEIIFKTNPHLIFLLAPTIFLFLLWIFYFLHACPTAYLPDFQNLCFVLSGIVFPSVILIVYLDWRFDRFYLTNLRVIKSGGFFGQKHMSIFLEQIENVTASYSFLGSLFNFGDLIIESAGTYGKITAEGIPNPLIKKWLIESAKKRMD